MPTPDFSKIWASNSPLPAYTFSDSDYLTGWDFVGSAPPTKNEFDAWFKLVDTKLNWLYSQLQDTASKLYPVGSVYISFNSADPSTLFGGTWTRLKDTFLLASGDTYAAGTTGGSATKTIAISNLPAHNHSVNENGNHSHTATTSTAGDHNHTASCSTTGAHYHGCFGDNGKNPYGIYDSAANHAGSSGADWNNPTGRTSTDGAHRHTVTIGATGNHTHTLTTNTTGSHTHTTNNTGGGLPLSIMPPYQTVYMWRRTA